MISAKDHLRHLIDLLTDEEAEELLDAAEERGLLANDLAPKSCSCPSCRERRMDLLEWTQDGDFVICASCGTCFDPNGPGALKD